MEKIIEFLAEQLRTRRKKAGMSQDDLAEKSGLSVVLISEIERGLTNPTIATLSRLAASLNVKVVELLDCDSVLDSPEYIKNNIVQDLDALTLNQLKAFLALVQATAKK